MKVSLSTPEREYGVDRSGSTGLVSGLVDLGD